MKYCVVILDGASGHPLKELGGKTCLEEAKTPCLDRLASSGKLGLASTVPEGMEPSSAAACSSILGFDPMRYRVGRGAIEAASIGVQMEAGDAAFRCNLVWVEDGVMRDYSAGHISTEESRRIIDRLNQELGDDKTLFFPGVGYRHLLVLKDGTGSLEAACTPPHDIPGRPIAPFTPRGPGATRLLELMEKSVPVLASDPVNRERIERGLPPASMIWLFWGGRRPSQMPSFADAYGLSAALTSGVDLLGGLARLFSIERLRIEGVTDGSDNDYRAQAEGALDALSDHDLVVIHVESPDEAGHSGDAAKKIEAIGRIDEEIIGRLSAYAGPMRILALPDHPTPVELRTHAREPVPFILSGPGVEPNGGTAFSEKEAGSTGLFVREGWRLMEKLVSAADEND
ncbi:MAG: cofactor-independent phosphoglycerate mutase [Actinobacteria bacterium]|nr:MAG: cofactor-independent phosphoglycerate mutase [Actinomycetota bacterium]